MTNATHKIVNSWTGAFYGDEALRCDKEQPVA